MNDTPDYRQIPDVDDPLEDAYCEFYRLEEMWSEPVLHDGNWLSHQILALDAWGRLHLLEHADAFWLPALESGHYHL